MIHGPFRLVFRPFREKPAESGMTIIEILIVIALIGTLMTIIMSNILDKGDEAKVDLAQISQKKLSEGLRFYRLHNGRYPSTEEGLKALMEAPSSAKKWRGPYSDEDKLKDPWDQPFAYEYLGGKSYRIISAGPDNEMGNEDDIIFPKDPTASQDENPISFEMNVPTGSSDEGSATSTEP